MGREILFKAKRVDNGEWVEGSLINLDADSGYCYIVEQYCHASTLPIWTLIRNNSLLVNPETICQYTGLTDKNGKKIWEKDIVSIHSFFGGEDEVVQNKKVRGMICYDSLGILSVMTEIYKDMPCYSDILFHAELGGAELDFEVNGNIFDNPELLEGVKAWKG